MKLKTSHLLIIFAILLGVVFLVKNHSKKNAEGSLRSEFFDIDMDALKQFTLCPMNDESKKFSIIKDNGKWFVEVNDDQKMEADTIYVTRSLSEMKKLRPIRLAGKTSEDWAKFGVDSSGTLLEMTDNNNTYSIIIGNLSFMNERQANTYVRIPKENETFAAENYMEGTFKAQVDQWRKKTTVDAPNNEWTSITITGSENTNLNLIQQGGQWQLNGHLLDSLSSVNLTNAFTSLNKLPFAKNEFISDLSAPNYLININGTSGTSMVTLSIYLKNNAYILSSSNNEGNWFYFDPSLLATIKAIQQQVGEQQ